MIRRALLLVAALLLPAGCATRPQADGCAGESPLTYVCGAEKPEDLVAITGTRWLVASGFATGAGLKLVDTDTGTLRRWFTGAPEQIAHNPARYPDCDAPPPAPSFTTRGLSFNQTAPGAGLLHVITHDSRESIEVFAVSWPAGGAAAPDLRWQGCLLLPPGHVGNSVATYRDGTVLVSVLTRPGTTITDFVQGARTGLVLERRPDERAFRALPGTGLAGNNGLETTADDSGFYVVAFGPRQVVRFDRGDTRGPRWAATAPGFMPDNIHRTGDRLIAAGMRADEPACGGVRRVVGGVADPMLCHRGWIVAELDPVTRAWRILAQGRPVRRFNGVSSALVHRSKVWLGSYQADRLAWQRTETNEPVR